MVSSDVLYVDPTSADVCWDSLGVCSSRWASKVIGLDPLASSTAIEGGSVVALVDRGADDTAPDMVGLGESEVCAWSVSGRLILLE